jgi:hypothetical protein
MHGMGFRLAYELLDELGLREPRQRGVVQWQFLLLADQLDRELAFT